jgi:outer membrane protein OmpA-like peptidoglycan-associated protein
MRNTTLLLLTLSIGFLYSCQPEKSDDAVGDADAASLLNIPGNVLGDNEVIFIFPDLPLATMHEAAIAFPEGAVATLDSIHHFLRNNPDQMLRITGMYDVQESSPEGFENLGMARAAHLKEKLEQMGIAPERMQTASVMEDLSFDDQGKVADGYRFAFVPVQEQEANAVDRIVYFWAAENLIRWDADLLDYTQDATEKLNANPGLKMVLTGHTDYNGNHLLGMMRAEALKDYFGRYGLDTSRVVLRSEGPDKPVAPNDTQENKSMNRRVEIHFE